MSKVQMDTEEVRGFVGHLERFKELLNEEVNSLNGHFHNLESWQDARRGKFSEVLDNLKSTFNEFDEAAQEQIAWLKERIRVLKEDY
ncbi:type VII secretion protein [Helicobacter pylori]